MKNKISVNDFEQIVGLIQQIPILNGHITNSNIDTEFYLEHQILISKNSNKVILDIGTETISFREFVNILSDVLIKNHNVLDKAWLKSNLGHNIRLCQHLLFDGCLHVLNENYLAAIKNFHHVYESNLISSEWLLIFNVITAEKIANDADIRKFISLIGAQIEPFGAESEIYGKEHKILYDKYLLELRSVNALRNMHISRCFLIDPSLIEN